MYAHFNFHFNYIRKNRYRDSKAPVDILRDRFPNINEQIFNLPPIRLEILYKYFYNKLQGGYHVPKPAQAFVKPIRQIIYNLI